MLSLQNSVGCIPLPHPKPVRSSLGEKASVYQRQTACGFYRSGSLAFLEIKRVVLFNICVGDYIADCDFSIYGRPSPGSGNRKGWLGDIGCGSVKDMWTLLQESKVQLPPSHLCQLP